MKKLVLVLAAAFVATGAFAQFNRGDKFLNARTTGLNFSSLGGGAGVGTTRFDLGVNGGYFLTHRLAADVTLGFDYLKVKGDKEPGTSFTFGVGARYYFWNTLYGRLGFGGNTVEEWDLLTGKKSTAFESALNLSVGYDLFLSEMVYFEPALYYNTSLGKVKANTFGLQLGLGVLF
jgi:hypothetical protein